MAYIRPWILLLLLLLQACDEAPSITDSQSLSFEVAEEEYFIQKHGIPTEDQLKRKFIIVEQIRQQMYVFRNRRGKIEGNWTVQGPGNLGARINSIAMNPKNPRHMLIGFSHGGIYLTLNGGQNWTPVFDREAVLAIGDLAFDPINTNIVYAGTGDANGGFYTGQGNGIYKSTDGGRNWTHLGLDETRIISEIIVDHQQNNIVYAAAIGYSYARNEHRGLYQSKDGGNTWHKILYISDSTGVSDIDMDPVNSSIVYAACFDKLGTNVKGIVQGHGHGIYKTEDKGKTWTKLHKGLPDTINGRIAIAIAPSMPNVIYARYVGPHALCGTGQHFNGLYKSTDYGMNWSRVNTIGLDCTTMGGFGWYFGRLFVHPRNPNCVLLPGVRLYRSLDGGINWSIIDKAENGVWVHVDHHDVAFVDSVKFFLATDGGLYQYITDLEWQDMENIPTTQFYRVAYNPNVPDQYFGGTQDNGSTGGNASKINAWPRIWGGDGFQMAFHPTNPDIFFVESQFGEIRMTLNRGFDFVNVVRDLPGPKNWDFPYQLSEHNPFKLIAGTDAVFIMYFNNSEFNWIKISPMLTANGRYANRGIANITSLDESKLDSNILIAGTNNGNVWVTNAYDRHWTNISKGLPEGYISSVKTSPSHVSTVYVTLSAHRSNDLKPKVFRSRDMGNTYESIAGNLPEMPVFDILVYPQYNDSVLFVATEIGVYASVDAGNRWERVGDNMPFIQVYDMEFNPSTGELMVGTYARGIQTFPLSKILERRISTASTNSSASFRPAISPNPTADFVTIQLPHGHAFEDQSVIQIWDTQGKIAQQHRTKISNAERLDCRSLMPGIFYLHFTYKGKSFVQKMIKI